jgi:DNA invertase Pin-like site-specific DNA recombinase
MEDIMAITERRVGAYARLSLEDSRAGESVSIENQKLMLTKHAKEQGWKLVEIYCDDGFSGTNQNRPALQRMLHDIKQKRINTLLVKDLSRLGRNYLEVGNLAEVTLAPVKMVQYYFFIPFGISSTFLHGYEIYL